MGQLADKIRIRREELGLSQLEVGRKLGLLDARSYLSRIEAGKIIPARARLDDLEKALGFAASELQSAALLDEQGQAAPAPTPSNTARNSA